MVALAYILLIVVIRERCVVDCILLRSLIHKLIVMGFLGQKLVAFIVNGDESKSY